MKCLNQMLNQQLWLAVNLLPQQEQLSKDFARATAEIAELEEQLAIQQMIEREEERIYAEEELLRQQEWMNAMDVAYEQGIYK